MNGRQKMALALVSAVLIAFQLNLMQILRFSQWYHFAYMVIAVALLAFGAAGTLLSLFKESIIKHLPYLLPLLLFSFGFTIVAALFLSQTEVLKFDTYLALSNWREVLKITFIYFLYFIPFLCGAVFVGLLFCTIPEHIGLLYFINLIGSGIGGLLVPILATVLPPQQVTVVLSAIVIAAGWLVLPSPSIWHLKTLGIIGTTLVILFAFFPVEINLSEYKGLRKALTIPKSKIIFQSNSPHGLLHITASPYFRYSPGTSLNNTTIPPAFPLVFVNGDPIGTLTDINNPNLQGILSHTTGHLPFILASPQRVMVVQSGCGESASQAVLNGGSLVMALESNESLIDAFCDSTLQTPSIYTHSSVKAMPGNPRVFLLTDTNKYDLIVLPTPNSFGGNAGINATSETFAYTLEALQQYWKHLSETGMIVVSCYQDSPGRYPLRLFNSLAAISPTNINEHLIIIKGWTTLTFILFKRPLSGEVIQRTKSFCSTNSFDIVLLSEYPVDLAAQNNQNNDTILATLCTRYQEYVHGGYLQDYPFRIEATTDNAPFFHHFIKFKKLGQLSRGHGLSNLPFIESGSSFLILTFVQISILAMVLILLPLLRIRKKALRKAGSFIYFGGIGIGYMFIEMVLIHKAVLYFNTPIFSTAIVLAVILIFSGIGSYVSGKISWRQPHFFTMIFVLIALLIIQIFFMDSLLNKLLPFSQWLKTTLFSLTLAPLAFVMGMPFPVGIQFLNLTSKRTIPWAWGINGTFSVVSAVLGTLLAIQLGFALVLWGAVFAYCLPMLSGFFWSHNH